MLSNNLEIIIRNNLLNIQNLICKINLHNLKITERNFLIRNENFKNKKPNESFANPRLPTFAKMEAPATKVLLILRDLNSIACVRRLLPEKFAKKKFPQLSRQRTKLQQPNHWHVKLVKYNKTNEIINTQLRNHLHAKQV